MSQIEIYKSTAGARAVRERTLELLREWPVPNQPLRVPTREGETFAVACGAESAPPLLLFHGSGATAAMWLGDVATWAAHFRVYAIDMIGEPGLSAPSRPPLASDAHALWLDDVLRGLGVERAALVGVSLGGWLARAGQSASSALPCSAPAVWAGSAVASCGRCCRCSRSALGVGAGRCSSRSAGGRLQRRPSSRPSASTPC